MTDDYSKLVRRSSGSPLGAIVRGPLGIADSDSAKATGVAQPGRRPTPSVRLIDAWVPRTADERLLSAALGRRRVVPLEQLVDDLTGALLGAAIADGGWIVDVGLWGQDDRREEARRLIDACPGLVISKA